MAPAVGAVDAGILGAVDADHGGAQCGGQVKGARVASDDQIGASQEGGQTAEAGRGEREHGPTAGGGLCLGGDVSFTGAPGEHDGAIFLFVKRRGHLSEAFSRPAFEQTEDAGAGMDDHQGAGAILSERRQELVGRVLIAWRDIDPRGFVSRVGKKMLNKAKMLFHAMERALGYGRVLGGQQVAVLARACAVETDPPGRPAESRDQAASQVALEIKDDVRLLPAEFSEKAERIECERGPMPGTRQIGLPSLAREQDRLVNVGDALDERIRGLLGDPGYAALRRRTAQRGHCGQRVHHVAECSQADHQKMNSAEPLAQTRCSICW